MEKYSIIFGDCYHILTQLGGFSTRSFLEECPDDKEDIGWQMLGVLLAGILFSIRALCSFVGVLLICIGDIF